MYKPKFKYELIVWLCWRYPKENIVHWRQMNKKQLYAIYYSVREKETYIKSDWQRDYDRAVDREYTTYEARRYYQ